MRTVSTSDDPFAQVSRYVEAIREGSALRPDGRPIRLASKDTPFFCYVVCDITPALERMALYFELTKTPDNEGFFGWKKHLNAYIEVISYNKLVDDSRKRNAVFFDKLGLPSRFSDSLDVGASA